MNEGWIKLHRKLTDCILWIDSEPFDRRSAWIDLLLLANHSDKEILFNGSPITISKGQYLTSVRKLAERWHWSNDRTLRYLRLLESLQMIHKESDKTRTLLTIVNYGIYQAMPNGDKDSNEYSDKDSDKSQTRKKECKNDKNNNHIGSFGSQKVDELFAEFVKMRKQMKKPMTAHAIELAVTKLEKLSGGIEDTAIKIIEQTLEHSWQTFYELKTDNRSRNQKSGTKFNDFEQTHNYDMTDLEKMLLS